MSRSQRLSKPAHDPYIANYTSPPNQQAADYVPLPLIGQIKEKGFSASSQPWNRVSVPLPKALPFPVARHRSEGPHWAPVVHQTSAVEEYRDEVDGAANAQPLERKKQRAIDISRWKQHFKANTTDESTLVVRPNETEDDSLHHKADGIDVSTYSAEPEGEEIDSSFKQGLYDKTQVESNVQVESFQDASESAPGNQVVLTSKRHSQADDASVVGIETEEFEAENWSTLQSMADEEILGAQSELSARLKPNILDMLRRRGMEKARRHMGDEKRIAHKVESLEHETSSRSTELVSARPFTPPKLFKETIDEDRLSTEAHHLVAGRQGPDYRMTAGPTTLGQIESVECTSSGSTSWSDRVEAVRGMKFGFDGSFMGIDSESLSSSAGGRAIHNVVERDILRTDGNPAAEGYTIKEAVALARSMVPAQRSAALRLLVMVLDNALLGLQASSRQERSASAIKSMDSVDWQAVWAYTLGPEPELVLTLRIALDDSHATVVATCAKVLQSLLTSSANEPYFNLCESLLLHNGFVFTAPIFRKSPSKEEGLQGSHRWKYNVKPSDMLPLSNSSQNVEGDPTVEDDAAIASQDVVAGLIRMGILPRIRYILEVEKLIPAEEHLFNVLIAFARHSPAAADAIMKCPRLLDTVLHLFLQNENMATNLWRARSKAIDLLKVLALVKKSNCIQIIEIGLFQASQLGLLHQGLLLSTQRTACQGHPGSHMGLVESLQLWRVCIQYKLGILFFPDVYPALLFWISPPLQQMQTSMDLESIALAEASFHVLEALASTLPMLHADKQESEDPQQTEMDKLGMSANATLSWSWKYAAPIVETSLGWLSPEVVYNCIQKLQHHDDCKTTVIGNCSLFLRIISSVLHFLSTLCERILNKDGYLLEDTESLWLPTFVPKLGSQLIKSGLLGFMHARNGSDSVSKGAGSLVDCILSFKKGNYSDAHLTATNCLHGLVRLLKALDCLLKSAKMNILSFSSYKPHDLSEEDEILACGLALSAKGELMRLLRDVGNDVIQQSHMLQILDAFGGRGGPAPGVGVGWGCPGGGYWSSHTLMVQTEAVLVTVLTDILFLQGGTGLLGSVGNDICPNEDKDTMTAGNVLWKIKLGFSVSVIAGPGSADFLGQVWSTTLLDESALNLFLDQSDVLLKRWLWKLGTEPYSQSSNDFMRDSSSSIKEIHHILLQQYRNAWLGRKMKAIKSTEHEYSKHAKVVNEKGWTSTLSTLREGCEPSSVYYDEDSLVTEWAGQRLPLPSHWLLSPLLGDVGSDSMSSRDAHRCCELSHASDQSTSGDPSVSMISDRMEAVRHGLVLLCGFEATAQHFPQLGFQIPLVIKIHALSTIFVLSDDIFLDNAVNNMIGALQELYVYYQLDCLPVQKGSLPNMSVGEQGEVEAHARNCQNLLDFEGLVNKRYAVFVEKLSTQFSAVSFGDIVFGRQLAIYLRRGVADSLRLKVWQVLETEHALELLPPLEKCCGHVQGYLYPFEENQEILKSYVSAWASGALDRARARNSVSFLLALFHVAAFIFIGRVKDKKYLLCKTLAKSLILGLYRRQQLQESLLQLLTYNVHDIRFSEQKEIETIPPSATEIASRCSFFHEVCAGFPEISTEVEHVEKLVSSQI